MRIIRTMRRQRAVYWEPGVEDNMGQTTYAEPVEVECRWEDVAEQYLDWEGNEATSRARVYVDRKLTKLGVLWLPPDNIMIAEGAALAQLTSDSDPFAQEGAYEIRRVDETPELRVRPNDPDGILHTVYL